MITITPSSKVILESVFSTTDVYHCSNFDPKWSSSAYGSDYEKVKHRMRYSHLYDFDGFTTTINKYITEPSRAFEFITYNDQPLTVRHRLNMIDTLISNDMKTNLPTHITIKPKFKDKEIEIEDLYKNDREYVMIIHPGFTRMNSSIFLNSPLRNVLIHINKEHNVSFKDHPSLQKIHTEEELVQHYSPFTDKKSYQIDFYIPNANTDIDKTTINGIKHHEGTNTPVLKSNGIRTEPYTKFESVHPSDQYALNTFLSFDKFCNILFSSPIKVYSQQKKLHNIFQNNIRDLSERIFGHGSTLHAFIIKDTSNRDHFQRCNSIIRNPELLTPEKLKFYKQFTVPLKEFHEKQTEDSLPHFYQNHIESQYLENSESIEHGILLNDKSFLKSLVEKNKFKGILILFSKEYQDTYNRTFSELLMCFSATASIIRNEDSSMVIVNCNHEFWTSSNNYVEKIINKNFFTI